MWKYQIEWVDCDGDTRLTEISDVIFLTREHAETVGKREAQQQRCRHHGVTPAVTVWPKPY